MLMFHFAIVCKRLIHGIGDPDKRKECKYVHYYSIVLLDIDLFILESSKESSSLAVHGDSDYAFELFRYALWPCTGYPGPN